MFRGRGRGRGGIRGRRGRARRFAPYLMSSGPAQTAPAPGQVENDDSGFSFAISDMKMAERMLTLGSSGRNVNTKREISVDEMTGLKNLVESAETGPTVVHLIRSLASSGRSLQKNALCIALAVACKFGSDETKSLAYEAIDDVCGIPTLLFSYLSACQTLKVGWGRRHRSAISRWFLAKNSVSLVYQATKYQARGGWTIRDALRVAHPKSEAGSPEELVFQYVIKGSAVLLEHEEEMPATSAVRSFLVDLERIKAAQSAEEVTELIRHRLALKKGDKGQVTFAREHCPTQFLNDRAVWSALLENMPLAALIRNLGKLTSIGVIGDRDEDAKTTTLNIVGRIRSKAALHAARIHPFTIFIAWRAYRNAKSRGGLEWKVDPFIDAGLEQAFYEAFHSIEATNKRFMVAIDVSGSMSFCGCGLEGVNCRDAAAVIAMSILRSEHMSTAHVFSSYFAEAPFDSNNTLDEVISSTNSLPFDMTDCSLPMVYATKNRLLIDCFVVLTDSETNCNSQPPHVALEAFRRASGITDAKLVVVAMSSNHVSIADPSDPYMVDVVGLDASLPQLIQSVAML